MDFDSDFNIEDEMDEFVHPELDFLNGFWRDVINECKSDLDVVPETKWNELAKNVCLAMKPMLEQQKFEVNLVETGRDSYKFVASMEFSNPDNTSQRRVVIRCWRYSEEAGVGKAVAQLKHDDRAPNVGIAVGFCSCGYDIPDYFLCPIRDFRKLSQFLSRLLENIEEEFADCERLFDQKQDEFEKIRQEYIDERKRDMEKEKEKKEFEEDCQRQGEAIAKEVCDILEKQKQQKEEREKQKEKQEDGISNSMGLCRIFRLLTVIAAILVKMGTDFTLMQIALPLAFVLIILWCIDHGLENKLADVKTAMPSDDQNRVDGNSIEGTVAELIVKLCANSGVAGRKPIDVKVTGGNSIFRLPKAISKYGDIVRLDLSEMTFERIGGNNEIAFQDCENLMQIKLPRTLKIISSCTFRYCKRLASVMFCENSQLECIESAAFDGCESLSDITLPSSLKAIDPSAFRYCNVKPETEEDPFISSFAKYSSNCNMVEAGVAVKFEDAKNWYSYDRDLINYCWKFVDETKINVSDPAKNAKNFKDKWQDKYLRKK